MFFMNYIGDNDEILDSHSAVVMNVLSSIYDMKVGISNNHFVFIYLGNDDVPIDDICELTFNIHIEDEVK